MPDDLTEGELKFLVVTLDLAREGRTDELAGRVARGVPANLTGHVGDSLLILAAYHNHPRTVRMLLEHGADPNRVNDRGQTALGAAVFRRSVESVQLLLDRGADPLAGERSAVSVAAFFGLDKMSALLRRGPTGPTGPTAADCDDADHCRAFTGDAGSTKPPPGVVWPTTG